MEAVKAKILEEYENGNVVIKTPFGLMCAPLNNFIAQSADSILYDLNRNEEVSLTLLSDPKWINDFAVAKVIRALKARIEELENWGQDMFNHDTII